MEFCPTCGTRLEFQSPDSGRSRFACMACPYICYLEDRVKIKRREPLVKKEIEPVFSKDDMLKGAETEATCPACNHGRALYHQMQIRSADEPMSTFYYCLNERCKNQWRED